VYLHAFSENWLTPSSFVTVIGKKIEGLQCRWTHINIGDNPSTSDRNFVSFLPV